MKEENNGPYDQQDRTIPNSEQQTTDQNSNPYDSENLDNESESGSKFIDYMKIQSNFW